MDPYGDNDGEYDYISREEAKLRESERMYASEELRSAARDGDSQLALRLLYDGADVNYQSNEDDDTPLDIALRFGRVEVAQMLMKRDGYARTRSPVFHYAVSKDYISIIKSLINRNVVNTKNRKGLTPFHLVRSEKVAKMLLFYGARVDTRDERTGGQPIHNCCRVDILHLLIEHGADVNSVNNQGETPLHNCWGVDLMRVLIEHGADVNSVDNQGKTPLHKAVGLYQGYDMAKLLLDNGSMISALSKEGKNLLHCVYIPRLSDSVPYGLMLLGEIMEHGIDIDAKDTEGLTPLHCAVFECQTAKIRVFLAKGADVNIVSNEGETPIELAERRLRVWEEWKNGEYWFLHPSEYPGDFTADHSRWATEYLRRHIIMLKVAGLHVSGRNFDLASSIKRRPRDWESRVRTGDEFDDPDDHNHTSKEINRYEFEWYERELNRLETNLGTRLSNLLATNNPGYIANTELRKRLNKIKTTNYPGYGRIVMDKFNRDKKRFWLLQKSKTLLVKSKLGPSLPQEIWEKILSYLAIVDLIKVAKVKPFSKANQCNQSM